MTEPPQILEAIQTKRWTNPDWLRWKRVTAGLRQEDLAARLGCGKQHISNIECGLTVCSERVRLAYEALEP